MFRKFAFVFGASINSKSLRHAALAWAAAFVRPPSDTRFWEQVQIHTIYAARAMISKTPLTIDLADLYAAFLLTLLSSTYGDYENYGRHLRGVKAIMVILGDSVSDQRKSVHISIFLPLVRDLLLETSRCAPLQFVPSCEVLEFVAFFQSTIGPITHIQRDRYCQVLFGSESRWEFTFLQAMWHHTTILRRSFRDSVTRQLSKEVGSSLLVQSLLAEIKSDLQSIKVKEVVNRLVILQSLPQSETLNDFMHLCAMFGLLLHRFCWYIIVLLEEESIVGSLESIGVITSASALLPLIDENWLVGDLLHLPTPFPMRRFLVLRILWMAGLALNPKRFPEGPVSPHPILITGAKLIISKIEKAGEPQFARVLERFWKHSDREHILMLLNLLYWSFGASFQLNSYIHW